MKKITNAPSVAFNNSLRKKTNKLIKSRSLCKTNKNQSTENLVFEDPGIEKNTLIWRIFYSYQNETDYSIQFIQEEAEAEEIDPYRIDKYSSILDFFGDRSTLAEIEPIEVDVKKNNLVIYDTMVVYKVWSIMIFMLLLVLMVYMPFQFSEKALDQHLEIVYFDLFIDCMFMTDMVINFFVAYYEKSGKVVDDRLLIIANYLTGWFLVDLVSSIPISYIIYVTGAEASSAQAGLTDLLKIPKLWRMVKFTKLFRLIKAIKYHNKLLVMIQKIKFSATLFKVVLYSGILLEVCHVFACIWIGMIPEGEDESWWMSWTQAYDQFDYFSGSDRYIVAWYFVVQTVTTVGYGDVPTTTLLEVWFKMTLIIFGVYTFNFVIATITQLQLENAIDNIRDRDLKEKIDLINVKYKLSGKGMTTMDMLQHKSTNKMLNEDYEIIFSLPEQNALEVMEDVYQYFIEKLEILANKSFKLVKELFKHMQMRYYFDNEPVYLKGESAHYLYFIAYGKLVLNEELLNKYELTTEGIYKVCPTSKYVGFDEFFIHETCNNSCYAKDQSEVYIISGQEYYNISEEFGHGSELYHIIKDSYRNYLETMVACIFIFHKYYKKNFYIRVYDIYELMREFEVEDFIYMPNVMKSDKFTQMIGTLDELIYSTHYNISRPDLPPLFDNELWFTHFLGDKKYIKLINDIVERKLASHRKLKFLEKVLVQKKKINLDGHRVSFATFLDHPHHNTEEVYQKAFEETATTKRTKHDRPSQVESSSSYDKESSNGEEHEEAAKLAHSEPNIAKYSRKDHQGEIDSTKISQIAQDNNKKFFDKKFYEERINWNNAKAREYVQTNKNTTMQKRNQRNIKNSTKEISEIKKFISKLSNQIHKGK